MTDWTALMADQHPLQPAEVVLGLLLLALALVTDLLARVTRHPWDLLTSPDTRLARRLDPDQVLALPRTLGYHYKSHYLSPPGQPRLHYLSEGPPDAPTVLLLLHGEPFWSFSWSRLLPHLLHLTGGQVRIVVPDLPGFGLSDKPVDWRQYNLRLHKRAVGALVDSLGLQGREVVLVGHNWGWMVGAGLARDRPDLFSKLVVLNTNNLPDGEILPGRYQRTSTWAKFMVMNSFFLFFRASMDLLRELFPLRLLIHSLNPSYNKTLVDAMVSPWPRLEDCGGTTAFPLMVPVFPSHPEAREMSEIRQFLSSWHRPVLVLYSGTSLLPWLTMGDFVVGNRAPFYRLLVPGVRREVRVEGAGHLVMWDKPGVVAREIEEFVTKT